jgi:hypothetical protein
MGASVGSGVAVGAEVGVGLGAMVGAVVEVGVAACEHAPSTRATTINSEKTVIRLMGVTPFFVYILYSICTELWTYFIQNVYNVKRKSEHS